jgi:hypothetical protein
MADRTSNREKETKPTCIWKVQVQYQCQYTDMQIMANGINMSRLAYALTSPSTYASFRVQNLRHHKTLIIHGLCHSKKHSVSSQCIHHKPVLIGLTFHYHFYQSSHKTWCLSAAPDSLTHFIRQQYTADTCCFLCWMGTNGSFGL